ncbi:Rpr2-domain-containing protein [Lentinus tigrinus ALCF2SS1-7]|uniref:Rpr2-domain-containing protein n=1 Tax=Lentinus tigrinus ALCF2SS1-6 TaxID=1328759 RepID=A0A5C2S266_9APHY|nr:Rpr2-domain-containing protein [Lentinus tigrinus ALCF2SS1-6]RPD78718.1 Rpr2-domain-containing protein [Lentinus tigrinus ALCF2SS1-7]
MGKKDKNQGPAANLHSVANRDIIQRINFLYQASTYLNTISSPAASSSSNAPAQPPKGKSKKKNTIRHPKSTAELSRCYIGSMRIVGQKAMVRMDPSIKRTLCKQCDTVLIPGSTASVRVRPLSSHGHAVVYICMTCNATRRIPAPPVFDPEAQPQKEASSADGAAVPSTSGSVSATASVDTMAVDPAPTAPQPTMGEKTKSRKKRDPAARLPPLFERKGHVVFRGNEILAE